MSYDQYKKKMWLVQRLKKQFEPIPDDPGFDDYFRLDYMGSSEFEWGAPNTSLQRICLNSMDFCFHEIDSKFNGNNVYVYCNSKDVNSISDIISDYVKTPYQLKEHIRLSEILKGNTTEYDELEHFLSNRYVVHA